MEDVGLERAVEAWCECGRNATSTLICRLTGLPSLRRLETPML